MQAAGDQRRRLIEAHLPLARRVAQRYAGRGEPADDLLQVGALALVRAVDRCDPDRKELAAYLARCVDGEIRHHLRDRVSVLRVPRGIRGPRPNVLELDEEVADDHATLDDVLLDRAAVASAARRLDDRERLVVLLVFFHDCTQAEAAARLGLSQPHVSRLLERALGKMRRHLEAGPLSPRPRGATLEADGDDRRQVAHARVA